MKTARVWLFTKNANRLRFTVQPQEINEGSCIGISNFILSLSPKNSRKDSANCLGRLDMRSRADYQCSRMQYQVVHMNEYIVHE